MVSLTSGESEAREVNELTLTLLLLLEILPNVGGYPSTRIDSRPTAKTTRTTVTKLGHILRL